MNSLRSKVSKLDNKDLNSLYKKITDDCKVFDDSFLYGFFSSLGITIIPLLEKVRKIVENDPNEQTLKNAKPHLNAVEELCKYYADLA